MSYNTKPKILEYYAFEEEHLQYLLEDNVKVNFKVKCKMCNSKPDGYSGSIKVTSNWISHLKACHKKEYEEYSKKNAVRVTTINNNNNLHGKLLPISTFCKTKKYPFGHFMQSRLDSQLAKLLVNSSMALQIIECKDFRLFVHMLNPQYRLGYRRRVQQTVIPKLFNKVDIAMRCALKEARTVTVTIDAWTDPRQRSFLGITAHYIDQEWNSKSILLHCLRFYGSHTGERIANVFDTVIDDYGISDKVTHIITDNAANMVAAFKEPSMCRQEVINDVFLDDGDVYEDLDVESINDDLTKETKIDDTLNDLSDIYSDAFDTNSNPKVIDDTNLFYNLFAHGNMRLSCVAHTLQLCIKDAILESTNVFNSVEHVASFVKKARKSNKIKEQLDQIDVSLVKRNATRWNSQFNMVRAFLKVSDDDLNRIFDVNPVLSKSQRKTLEELVMVLEDFATVTTIIQTDSFSIGHIVPLIKGLKLELDKLKGKLKYCEKLRSKLLESIINRFRYLENTPLYHLAAILSPRYGTNWLEGDLDIEKWLREIETEVNAYIKKYPVTNNSNVSNSSDDKSEEVKSPPKKKIKCLSYINSSITKTNRVTVKTIMESIKEYVQVINTLDDEELTTGVFWKQHETIWPELSAFAKYVLSIPATSSPVERVFSIGGSILSVKRRKLSDHMFNVLIMLKCNMHIIEKIE